MSFMLQINWRSFIGKPAVALIQPSMQIQLSESMNFLLTVCFWKKYFRKDLNFHFKLFILADITKKKEFMFSD